MIQDRRSPAGRAGLPSRSASGLHLPPDPSLWLGARLALYQDDARTTAATADTNPVGSASDRSGRARHASQATAGSRPTLSLTGCAGRPSLVFDGAASALATPGWASNSGSSTTFLVARFQGETGTRSTFLSRGESDSHQALFRTAATDKTAFVGTPNTLTESGVTYPGVWRLWSVRQGPGSLWSLRKNGVDVATGTFAESLPTTNAALYLAAAHSGAGYADFGKVQIAECLSFDRYLSDGDLTRTEESLARYYHLYPPGSEAMSFWLRADSLLASDTAGTLEVTAEDAPVGFWTEQASGAHPTQATAGKRPLIKNNVRAGRRVLRFDGIDDWLTASIASLAGASAFTVFLVLMANAPAADARLLQGQNNKIIAQYGPSDFHIFYSRVDTAGTGQASYTPGAWSIHTIVFDGSQAPNATRLKSYLGDTQATLLFSGTVPAVSAAGATFGIGARDTGTTNWSGDLAEILIYPAALADRARRQKLGYLQSGWGF